MKNKIFELILNKYLENNECCCLTSTELYENFEDIKEIKQFLVELLNENKIDLYEDTISYQLGFDKGKEYLQQIIDNAKEYIKNILKWVRLQKDWETEKILLNLLILLGDKENE